MVVITTLLETQDIIYGHCLMSDIIQECRLKDE